MQVIQEVHNDNTLALNLSDINFTEPNKTWDTQNSSTAYKDHAAPPNYAALSLIPLILTIAVGNILVITLVGCDRRLRSATNCFLSSLAVTDMLVALIVMPLSLAMIVNNYNWPFSDELCGLWVMLDVFFSTCSILHLCMISFDRYLALAQPFSTRHFQPSSHGNGHSSITSLGRNRQRKNLGQAGKRIFFVWSIALGIAVPIPILGKIDRNNLFVEDMCAINIAEFQIFGSLVAFFLPLIIMFIMYTLTIRTLKRQARLVSNIMVQNSPPCIPSRTSQNRLFNNSLRRKVSTQTKEYLKDPGRVQIQYHRKTLENTEESDVFVSDMEIHNNKNSIRNCSMCQNKNKSSDVTTDQEKSWRKTLRMITNFFRSIQGKNKRSSNRMTTNNNISRCTCRNNKQDYVDRSPPEDLILQQRSRSSRANHGRVSSSFKNRAMASINNEQRASKVLGVIFVLFCVFWCPFFITNVTSRLCTSCNQELLGNLMNWFVWVGYVSSGVNPCVYTMFSRRFRRTFMLVMSGKFSEINRNPHLHRTSARRATSSFSTRIGSYRLSSTHKPSLSSLAEEEGIIKTADKSDLASRVQKCNSEADLTVKSKLWRWPKDEANK